MAKDKIVPLGEIIVEKTTLSDALNHIAARDPSHLLMHSSDCCHRARTWFIAMARSYTQSGINTHWMHDQWEWGPSKWPMYWCEIMENKKLDCGVLADLAETALIEAWQETVRVQLIEEYDHCVCQNWRKIWDSAGCDVGWIIERFAYHEVVGILTGCKLKVWDPSNNSFTNFNQSAYLRHGRVMAIRLVPSNITIIEEVDWCGLKLPMVSGWQNCSKFYLKQSS